MTPKFFYEFLRGMEYTSKNLKNPNNTIPTLFMYGKNDPVGNFGKGVAKVFKAYHKHYSSTEMLKEPTISCTIMKAAKRCLKKSRGIWTSD